MLKRKIKIDWPDSKDSVNIAKYMREMQYTPEKTEDILKYYESLKPANLSVSNNNSNNCLKRTLDRK